MKFEEYALQILKTTEESYVGSELDLRFDIVNFILQKLSSIPMTQSKLAAKLKMKPSQLNRILKSESNLTIETIARIFHAFGSRPTIKEKREYVIHKAIGEDTIPVRQQVIADAPKAYSFAGMSINSSIGAN